MWSSTPWHARPTPEDNDGRHLAPAPAAPPPVTTASPCWAPGPVRTHQRCSPLAPSGAGCLPRGTPMGHSPGRSSQRAPARCRDRAPALVQRAVADRLPRLAHGSRSRWLCSTCAGPPSRQSGSLRAAGPERPAVFCWSTVDSSRQDLSRLRIETLCPGLRSRPEHRGSQSCGVNPAHPSIRPGLGAGPGGSRDRACRRPGGRIGLGTPAPPPRFGP
jgi:hypothetical protein